MTTFAENDVRKNNDKPLTMFNKKSSGRRRRGNRRKKSEMSSRLMQDETDRSQHSNDYVTKKSSRNFPCSSKRGSQHGSKNDNKHCSQSATMESFCSTCSSSSDSDTEDFAYKLPERKIYGGVRLNYISNDALSNLKRNKNDKNNSSSSNPLNFFKLKF